MDRNTKILTYLLVFMYLHDNVANVGNVTFTHFVGVFLTNPYWEVKLVHILKERGDKMTTGMSDEQIYEQAKKRVEARKGFYVHLTVYICVNIFLVLIWAFVAGRGFPWFIFPVAGWGIAIIIHGVSIFVGKSDKAAIAKEAEKIKREQM